MGSGSSPSRVQGLNPGTGSGERSPQEAGDQLWRALKERKKIAYQLSITADDFRLRDAQCWRGIV